MRVRPPSSYRVRGTFYRRCIICWVRSRTAAASNGGILDDVRDDRRSALLLMLLLAVLLVLQWFVQKHEIRLLALMKNQR